MMRCRCWMCRGALDLEDFERRMTVLEEKLAAALAADADEEALLEIRREMDRSLAPYRRKMSAEQLSQLGAAVYAEAVVRTF